MRPDASFVADSIIRQQSPGHRRSLRYLSAPSRMAASPPATAGESGGDGAAGASSRSLPDPSSAADDEHRRFVADWNQWEMRVRQAKEPRAYEEALEQAVPALGVLVA